ncbi:altronate dehydratase [Siculibacillus lacustris]|uniref:Altronate dehydratase n=1 Tax=Siculibacillus lacustris TaxID=1549641 RepID=A0A4Q9VDP2_9HYPH|nr:altronate dehydratase family protein [Siculibacillus lacustris]TBW32798.1 altronate dehydratase [Siculibacillus lacustris]
MTRVLRIHSDDTVAVALEPIAAGTVIPAFAVTLGDDIPQGHKFAIAEIAEGDRVIKYGAVIGIAKEAIAPGRHVHTHNLKTALGGIVDYAYSGHPVAQPNNGGTVPKIAAFVRSNGDIGIRNDLWIVPLVGCINGLAQNIAKKIEAEGMLPEGSKVAVLAHPYGCSQLGDDLANTRGILQNYAQHPNAGGVLILGLGCENNTKAYFSDGFAPPDPRRVRFLISQEAGDEEAEALTAARELAAVMAGDVRSEVGADRLRVGLKCGGSDGFSGITANPLLGAFSDWLCGIGGTTVLTEVPEMFGAEQLLMERAENRDVFEKTVALVNDFKEYYIANKQPIYENPSPGNKAGGISTLEEKSLGCTQKAGLSTVHDVLKYTDRIHVPGLNLLSAPGNDGVAVTALAASGCHMVLFTTGRGTPLGGVVPTVKVATNSTLAERKPHWIDFDAGPIATGAATVADLRDSFVDTVLAVASGNATRNETNGIGEIVIFKTGVTL